MKPQPQPIQPQSHDIAMQELYLNLKHQKIEVKGLTTVGYKFEKGIYIFMILIPKGMLGFKLKSKDKIK